MIPREPRLPTHSPIILAARGFGRHFVLENVSKSGAGVVGDKPLRVGEKVTLNFKSKSVDAVVRWATESKAGVAFKERLDDGLLRSLVGSPMDQPTARMN
ncbi:PilZ domain-containing protein [Pseudooctadecabacter sp.]|uniref:PilZ domain-containing protein n=1 Tax=Pseudooctadecabacter sp. TaxID=1966338 RepID=UPI0035C7C77F